MQSSLGKPTALIISILLAFFRVLAGLAILAVLLGRSAPEPETHRPPRKPAHPRYLDISCNGFPSHQGSTPQLLDTETGAFTPAPVTGERNVAQLSCSPWRDGEGQYQLAGRYLDKPRNTYALLRCTFPEGRVLDRVGLDMVPFGRLCWSPDRSDRILFSSLQGLLYLYEFGETRGGRSPASTRPRELQWRTSPPGVGRVLLRDPCWPSLPALDGRLLVALYFQEDLSRLGFRVQLWWLQLSPDNGEIVSAERAIVPPGTGLSPQDEERLPGVGMGRDGTLLLAYLVLVPDRGDFELWVMPIAPAASGRGPRVLVSAGHKLAEGCAMALAPTFSADGRWVYASRLVDQRLCLNRFDVAVAQDAASGAADRPAWIAAMAEPLVYDDPP